MAKVQSGKSLFTKQIIEQFVKAGWKVTSTIRNGLSVKTQ